MTNQISNITVSNPPILTNMNVAETAEATPTNIVITSEVAKEFYNSKYADIAQSAIETLQNKENSRHIVDPSVLHNHQSLMKLKGIVRICDKFPKPTTVLCT